MRPAILALLTLFLGACGWSATPRDSFPIGLYDVDSPVEVSAVARAGFDTLVTAKTGFSDLEPLAKEASKRGLRMVIYPNLLKEHVATASHWPILAWYLFDEPDTHGAVPAKLEELASETKALDPSHWQTLVLAKGIGAARFGSIGDAMMLDSYPVPYVPLETVAHEIDQARADMPAGKPLWFVVQAFNWDNYPQYLPPKHPVGRFPEESEMRFMSYIAVMHGAGGLFYYSLNNGGQPLYESPALWQALSLVVSEVRAMRPIWRDGSRVALPFTQEADGPEAACWRYHARDYVVLANGTDKPASVAEALLSPRWRPLFEASRDQRDALQKNGDRYYLPANRVLVLEGPLFGR